MKIVVLDGRTLSADDNPWTPLFKLGDVQVHDQTTVSEILPRAQGAGVLIVNKVPLSATTMEKLPDLRFIAVCATGYDCVDVTAARRRGIPVSNVPEYGTVSVAQFTFALLLELTHRVGLHVDAVRAGEWARSGDFSFWKTPQIELAGKIMGIVGFGRIGQSVGRLAHAFGMEVLAHDAFRFDKPLGFPFTWADQDDVFHRADVVSVHCPLIPETTGLVNAMRLRLMKKSAFFINAARGGLVVEQDLADALNRGDLAAAVLDVVSSEPIRSDNPLLKAKNCLITPHIAWASREARRRLLEATVGNVAAFLAGKSTNVVN
jgi:glycerate dehydrogenase